MFPRRMRGNLFLIIEVRGRFGRVKIPLLSKDYCTIFDPMKLWHQDLIPVLPNSYLAALHRDVCALRGKRWGLPSCRVKHLWNHPFSMLSGYHRLVIREMLRREWRPDGNWLIPGYRGKRLPILPESECSWDGMVQRIPEHTEAFRKQGIFLLREKVLNKTGNWTPEDVARVESILI